MARTKLIARANYNCRKANYQQRRVSSGIKSLRVESETETKIKQIIPRSRNTEVKKMHKLLEEWLWEEKQYFRELSLLNIEYHIKRK